MNEIIGQDKLLEMLNYMVENDTIPHFMVFTGEQGSGRRSIAKWLAEKLDAQIVFSDVKIENIRNIVEQSYKLDRKCIFVIDAQFMNSPTQSVLLKVTEEPPKNAYFVLVVNDGRSISQALQGRATTYKLEKYSFTQIRDFASKYGIDIKNHTDKLAYLLRTPGDVINFASGLESYKELENFTVKVIDNIGKVEGANAFKIANSISFKDGEDGYILKTFWTMFMNVCLQRARDTSGNERKMYYHYIDKTTEYMRKLDIVSLNKRSLFDMWILEIREVYTRYNVI